MKRSVIAAIVLVVSAGVGVRVGIWPANAAGTQAGAATIKSSGGTADLSSGDSSTVFTLRLPSGAACPGDSTNDGYRWQAYMVSAEVDETGLQFGSTGPTNGSSGVSGEFKQALYTTTGSAITNKNTADKTPPATSGPILDIPDMSLGVWAPGDIPAGVYELGIACTLGPAGPDQMKNFWSTKMTVSTTASGQGGPAQITWVAGDSSTTTTTVAPTTTTSAPATTTTTSAPTTTTTVVGPTTTTTVVPPTTTTTEAPTPTTTTTEAPTPTTTTTVPDNTVSEPVAGGETVSTGDEATADEPVQTQVEVPESVGEGTLTITTTDVDGTPPSGFFFVGKQVELDGPAATVEDPYVVTFLVDSSARGGRSPESIAVFRSGVAVDDCIDATQAVPDPCIVSRVESLDTGDVEITVRTSQFSTWNFGLAVVGTNPCANPTITGTPGRDTIRGTEGPDVIDGKGGNDTIYGLGGDDIICGGSGNDTVSGGAGDDYVYGNTGADKVYGGEGRDHLYGGAGRDEVYGGNGRDSVHGGPSDDLVSGGDGNDGVFGDRGNDKLDGGTGFSDNCQGDGGTDSATACENTGGIP